MAVQVVSAVQQRTRADIRTWLRWAGRTLNVVFTALVVVALALLAASVAPGFWGWRSFIVLSGSMQPAIPMGSVVVAQPTTVGQLKERDVISFAKKEQPDTVITHRVIDIRVDQGKVQVSTKGDANATADAWIVSPEDQVSRVVYWVPLAGFLIAAAGSDLTKLILVAAIVLSLVLPRLRLRRRQAPTAGG